MREVLTEITEGDYFDIASYYLKSKQLDRFQTCLQNAKANKKFFGGLAMLEFDNQIKYSKKNANSLSKELTNYISKFPKHKELNTRQQYWNLIHTKESVLLKDKKDLVGLRVLISRPNGTSVGVFKLDKSGLIDGSKHPNETSWNFEKSQLQFLNKQGEVTSYFPNIAKTSDGQIVGYGFFIDGFTVHLLKSTDCEFVNYLFSDKPLASDNKVLKPIVDDFDKEHTAILVYENEWDLIEFLKRWHQTFESRNFQYEIPFLSDVRYIAINFEPINFFKPATKEHAAAIYNGQFNPYTGKRLEKHRIVSFRSINQEIYSDKIKNSLPKNCTVIAVNGGDPLNKYYKSKLKRENHDPIQIMESNQLPSISGIPTEFKTFKSNDTANDKSLKETLKTLAPASLIHINLSSDKEAQYKSINKLFNLKSKPLDLKNITAAWNQNNFLEKLK